MKEAIAKIARAALRLRCRRGLLLLCTLCQPEISSMDSKIERVATWPSRDQRRAGFGAKTIAISRLRYMRRAHTSVRPECARAS